MAAKRFNTKVDLWILLILVAVVVADFFIIVDIAMHPREPVETTVTILACIAAIVLIVSLLTRTRYIVDKKQLRIISGPLRWTIAIDEITAVVPTRCPLSSPAMSLDRLRIEYGNGRRIMISPKDKNGFLRAIGRDNG